MEESSVQENLLRTKILATKQNLCSSKLIALGFKVTEVLWMPVQIYGCC